jgi:hypothetical protein
VSTSKTVTSSNGLRSANVSSPAPSTTYCVVPWLDRRAASVSSANRDRATMFQR